MMFEPVGRVGDNTPLLLGSGVYADQRVAVTGAGVTCFPSIPTGIDHPFSLSRAAVPATWVLRDVRNYPGASEARGMGL